LKLVLGNKISIEIIKKINITSVLLIRGMPRLIIMIKIKNNLKSIQKKQLYSILYTYVFKHNSINKS